MTRPCPGPLPPRKPAVALPPGACDTHVHILGPYDMFPMVEDRGYTAPEAPVAKLKEMMATLGLSRCVIVHVTAHGDQLRVTLDALRQLRPNARGIAVFDPNTADLEMNLMHAGGIRGIRLTPLMGDDPSYEDLERLAKRIARLDWHLVLMPSGRESWRKLAPRLKDLPVEVVLDHFAWRGWDIADPSGVKQPGFQAVLEAAKSGRCWVKLAGPERFDLSHDPQHPNVRRYAEALIEAAPDRLIWGSDWPHVRCWDHPVPDDAGLVELLAGWIPDSALRNRILVDNPARLYGFNP
jgi:predicted TIM-barrel fold metal-dependent hydrolase